MSTAVVLLLHALGMAAASVVTYLFVAPSGQPATAAAGPAVPTTVGTLEELMLQKLQGVLGTAAHTLLESFAANVIAPAIAAHTPALAAAPPAH